MKETKNLDHQVKTLNNQNPQYSIMTKIMNFIIDALK